MLILFNGAVEYFLIKECLKLVFASITCDVQNDDNFVEIRRRTNDKLVLERLGFRVASHNGGLQTAEVLANTPPQIDCLRNSVVFFTRNFDVMNFSSVHKYSNAKTKLKIWIYYKCTQT